MTAQARPRALLVVVAHPDDESLACGATIARAAAAGVAVTIASLTRGDAGPTSAGFDGQRLGDTRAREFEAAGRVLGATRVVLRDHPDGMLPWLDQDLLVAEIADLIHAARADTVITFGADGLYWHPDHIAVHERTTEAVARLGRRGPALYYVTMPPGQMRAVAEADPARRPVVPGLPDADAFGAAAAAPTLIVPSGPFAIQKLAAIRCHRSQFADSAFASLGDAAASRLLGVEHFHRASVGSASPSVLDALAAPPAPSA